MNRSLIMTISLVTTSICILFNTLTIKAGDPGEKGQIITQEQAAELAAKLANEKYQTVFGVSPFKPESYQAQLIGTRWQWGKINAVTSVRGCSARVEFNRDGSEPDVKVAFHTDENISHDNPNNPMSIRVLPDATPQEIEEILQNMPNERIDLRGKEDNISKTPAD